MGLPKSPFDRSLKRKHWQNMGWLHGTQGWSELSRSGPGKPVFFLCFWSLPLSRHLLYFFAAGFLCLSLTLNISQPPHSHLLYSRDHLTLRGCSLILIPSSSKRFCFAQLWLSHHCVPDQNQREIQGGLAMAWGAHPQRAAKWTPQICLLHKSSGEDMPFCNLFFSFSCAANAKQTFQNSSSSPWDYGWWSCANPSPSWTSTSKITPVFVHGCWWYHYSSAPVPGVVKSGCSNLWG